MDEKHIEEDLLIAKEIGVHRFLTMEEKHIKEIEAALLIAKEMGELRFLMSVCLPHCDDYDEEPALKEKHIRYFKQLLAFLDHQSIKVFDPYLREFPLLRKPVQVLAGMLKEKQITPKKCRSLLKRVCHEELLEAFIRTEEEMIRDVVERLRKKQVEAEMNELLAQERRAFFARERAEHPERADELLAQEEAEQEEKEGEDSDYSDDDY